MRRVTNLAALATLLQANSPVSLGTVLRRFVRGTDVTFETLEQTISRLERGNLSLIRWGDGETEVALGRGIHYQDGAPQLSKMLQSLLSSGTNKVILGLPSWPLRGVLRWALYQRGWLKTRLLWAAHCHLEGSYADAFMFRDRPRKALQLLRACGARKKRLIIVSSNSLDVRYFDGTAEGIAWIEVPKVNAFSRHDETCAAIEYSTMASADSTLVLISAGPAGKAIAVALAERIACWDTGNLFDALRKLEQGTLKGD